MWIKSIDSKKRINNKTEFHQPGDVEVHYKKNENEEVKKRKEAYKAKKDNKEKLEKEKENANEIEHEPTQPTIMDFIKKVRFENENKVQENNQKKEDEYILSTQEMINDSRERRLKRSNEFVCDSCEYKSPSKTLLRRHMENFHKIDNSKENYPCNQCEYKATTKDGLKVNKNLNHNETMYQCNQCDYKASTKDNISEHTNSHHEETKHHCNQCEYKATTNTNLKGHIEAIHGAIKKHTPARKHTSKRLKCEICQRRFNKVETLERHKNSDHKLDTQSKLTFQIKLRSQVNIGNDLPCENERTLNQENQK